MFQETYANILACDYTTDEPEFEDISDEAKDFISRLLVIDCNRRLSASEALLHPWLQPQIRSSRRISMIQTSPKLTDVMARLRWQKCTNVLTACSTLNKTLNQ